MLRNLVLSLIVVLLASSAASAANTSIATPAPYARMVSDDEIASAIQEKIGSESGKWKVHVNKMNAYLFTTDTDKEQLQIADFNWDKPNNIFSANATIATTRQVIRVTGRINPLIAVPVLNSQRNAGETIQESDIAWMEVEDNNYGNARSVTALDQVVGKNATRPIAANTIIRTNMIASPKLVRKNTLITIIYQTDVMSISSRVRAMEDGALGDAVRVLNTSSNKMIDAVVTGSDEVSTSNSIRTKSIAMK